jgi:hypothetical protein
MRTKLGSWMGVSVLVAACTSLPDIPRNTCGNHVLEAREDCDTSVVGADATVCRAPGQAGACRFDCSQGTDGNRTPCPTGWGCGTDDICRMASGGFAAIGTPIPSDALAIGLSDYDGDGLQDVREVSKSDIRLRYGDPTGNLGQTFLISAPGAHPAAGNLTTDTLLDLTFTSGNAVAVWRGAGDHTMSPTTYPSIPIPTNDPVSFVTAEVLRKRAGLEVVTLIPDKVGSILAVRGSDETNATGNIPLFALKQTAADLIVPMQAAQLAEDPAASPCDEIVLAFKNSPEVDIFPTCRGDGANVPGPNQRTLPPVLLPAGRTVTNVLVKDLDRDGHMDLLILADEGGYFFALGAGDGTFIGPVENTDLRSRNLVALDVGFLSDDDKLYIVTPDGIALITPTPTKTPKDAGAEGGAPAPDAGTDLTTLPSGVNWNEARIVDLNGDGRLDVVAASSHRLDVLINAGGRLFDPHPYRLDGTPSLLAFGDFDGDLVMDIAFKEHFDSSTPDALSVGFGTTGGVPLEPVRQGNIGKISVISAGPLSDNDPTVAADGLADIGALAKTTDGKIQFVSVLLGSPDRLLQSPLVLTRTKNKVITASLPHSFAVGQFTNDTHADIASIALEQQADKSFEAHAWLVPVTGDAAIDLATLNAGPAIDTGTRTQTHGLSWVDPPAEMLAVDLDAAPQGGTDEVLVLAQPVQESQDPGALFVLKVDATGAFAIASKVNLGKDAIGGFAWSLKKADVDADGAPDVLVTFHDETGMHAQVYFNKRNGTLDPSPTVVKVPDGTKLTSWAALNADGDREKELALVTDKGVFLAKLDPGGTSFTVSTKPLTGVPAVGNVIACGDIDGDGIDDIALGGLSVLQVFRGLPVLE